MQFLNAIDRDALFIAEVQRIGRGARIDIDFGDIEERATDEFGRVVTVAAEDGIAAAARLDPEGVIAATAVQRGTGIPITRQQRKLIVARTTLQHIALHAHQRIIAGATYKRAVSFYLAAATMVAATSATMIISTTPSTVTAATATVIISATPSTAISTTAAMIISAAPSTVISTTAAMVMPAASGAEGTVVRTGNARVAATARSPRTTGHQEVITSTSIQRIVAGTAVNAVIAGPAEQQVITFARPDHIVAAAAVDRIVAAIIQVDRVMPFACGDKDVVIPSGHVKPGAVIIQHDRFQVGIRLDIRRVGYA